MDEKSLRPSLLSLFRVFGTIGAISFGGGAVGYLRQALVQERQWLNDEEFISGLELSQTLPGLVAANMSIYVGQRLRGAPGAIVSLLGLILPGLLVVMALGVLYSENHHNPRVKAALDGVAAAATGFLFAVACQLGRHLFMRPIDLILLMTTFGAMSLLRLPMIVIVLVLGGMGVLFYRPPRHPHV
jgi:chromate transporter